MTQDVKHLSEREPRFQVVDVEKLDARIELPSSNASMISTRLVDVSSRGAKVRLAERLEDNQQFTLTLEADSLPGPIVVAATVRWTRLAGGVEWWLGCEFEPPIPASLLDDFAKSGALNRRESQRDPTDLEARVYLEGQPEPMLCRLENVSQGGVALVCPAAPNVGSRIRIEPIHDDCDVSVTARVVWQVQADDEFVIGCHYGNAGDGVRLRRLASDARRCVTAVSSGWRGLLRVFGGK